MLLSRYSSTPLLGQFRVVGALNGTVVVDGSAADIDANPTNIPDQLKLVSQEGLFRHLVYPHQHGLHASLDMAGQLRFGPDSEWVDAIDYEVDEARAPKFYDAVREFWPELPDGALRPGWAGVRPKIGRARAFARSGASVFPSGDPRSAV